MRKCIQFKILSDHKALKSVLKPNRGNKTFFSRLTRWVVRLLPFEFEVVHVPDRTLGMADYFSKHPTQFCGSSIKQETLWKEWFTVNSVISLNDVLDGSDVNSEKGKAAENANEVISINRIRQASRRQLIKSQNRRHSR